MHLRPVTRDSVIDAVALVVFADTVAATDCSTFLSYFTVTAGQHEERHEMHRDVTLRCAARSLLAFLISRLLADFQVFVAAFCFAAVLE